MDEQNEKWRLATVETLYDTMTSTDVEAEEVLKYAQAIKTLESIKYEQDKLEMDNSTKEEELELKKTQIENEKKKLEIDNSTKEEEMKVRKAQNRTEKVKIAVTAATPILGTIIVVCLEKAYETKGYLVPKTVNKVIGTLIRFK